MIIPGVVRGSVFDNKDPNGTRRIRGLVPALFGNNPTGWAPACGTDSVPEIGQAVFFAFELGDPASPVWMGSAATSVGGGRGGSKTDLTYFAPKHLSTAPISGSSTSVAFVNEALQQIGKPYVYGAAGPFSFDCSGLVQYCLVVLGYTNPPRTSEDQWAWCQASGTTISESELLPGDLIFEQWPGDDAPPGHVVIYYGGGEVIEAPHTGADVHVRAWSPTETEIIGYADIPGLTYPPRS